MAAYTRCFRCARAPRRPTSGSGLGTPDDPAIRFTRGTDFGATLVRDCYGLPSCNVRRTRAFFSFLGCPRTRKGSQSEGLTMRHSCGAPPQARKDSRQEPHGSRPVESPGAGWACPPAPNPPHPIRPIGPGLPQKAGVSLFVATATPSQRVATRSSRAVRDICFWRALIPASDWGRRPTGPASAF
jgi:hypothetical protein